MDEKWTKALDRLESRRETVQAAGGQARIDKQHASGKLTARERMEALFDDDTFVEINDMMTSRAVDFGMDKKRLPGDGVITGYGKIHGRTAVASSQDFTVNGGSLGEVHAQKIVKAMDLAMKLKVPFISINDSGGARIEEGIDSLSGYGDIFYRNTMASGVIPQISVIMGPCAGGACYSPAICDYIFMTRESSQMYITGPAVVKSVTGEEISAKDLGGAAVHAGTSGVAHFVYDDDLDCLNGVRRLIGYLPQNNDDYSLEVPGEAVDESASLADIVPSDSRAPYDVKDVINSIVDLGSFMEVQQDFAMNIVVGFARIDGKTVGIVANQSNYIAGSLEIDSSDKAARFIRFCDCFNIPLVTLIDVPAFMPGRTQEHGGIIRHGAKMLYAYSEATVPKISVIMRKAYGGAYIAMNSKGLAADIVYAWPIAEIAVMGASGAVSIIGRKAIEAAEDKDAKRAELIDEYNDKFMNPYVAAERGYVDAVIRPEETREKIVSALELLEDKDEPMMPYKKHGNIPL
ncbi:MAG: acyl-CoA carboxylase subunit beta [Clostridiales bacterium]|nr:acyl-CoA carboxylase subunit beta [Clostridiales bacterium]MBP3810172.1 acyl-CoA carboxylase subunit beta [Clostridiales bacterium]